MMLYFRRALLAFVFIFFCTPIRAELTADNLLLIVNKNEPEGEKLAVYYAQQRHVPTGRIVSLDLPTTDDIAPDDYDQKMVTPIRQFILDHDLQLKIKCLVTFYGVPLRIPARIATPELRAELVSVRKQLPLAIANANEMVTALEGFAKQIDSLFHPPAPIAGLSDIDSLRRRAEAAANFAQSHVLAMPPGPDQNRFAAQLTEMTNNFRAPVAIAEATSSPATSQAASAPAANYAEMSAPELRAKMAELSQRRGEPAARLELRNLLRQQGGAMLFAQVLDAQEQYLTVEDSQAAVDNELAMLWWDFYPRSKWQINPLNFKYPGRPLKPPMMVMRLDAPTPELVHSMIDASIKTEAEGLRGRVALDSRGMVPHAGLPKDEAAAVYDQTIRDLGKFLKDKTNLKLFVDDKPTLIPPNSVKDCAVYCGWYSAGHYSPSVSFVPGGVGFHIGSYELLSLHRHDDGWCQGLIKTGDVATLGPCAEPYLSSFPNPTEFFPLLFTGKLTMAEVFWKTNTLVSWQISMVGDPLYTPFKSNPALKVDDLPEPLRGIFPTPTTAP